jgi:hypothetical protein
MMNDITSLKSSYAHMLPMNKEYDNVEEVFQKSTKRTDVCISTIYKINNQHVQAMFDERLATITEKRNITPEVIQVFHGTTMKAAKGIIETGFDVSFSTVAAFGKGTYASPQVGTALQYCKDANRKGKFSMVFLCRFIKGVFGAASCGIIDTSKFDYSGNGSNIYVTPYNDGIIADYLICYYAYADK